MDKKIEMDKKVEMYKQMMKIFNKNSADDELYDVDMFTIDITKALFVETDPQNIDEDEYLAFQEALILLVRDDLLLDWFGLTGLCIIHAELMNDGEKHYLDKVIFNNKED